MLLVHHRDENLPKLLGDLRVTEFEDFLPTLKENISVIHISLPPGGVHETVRHDFTTESVYVLAGSARGIVGKESFLLRAGNWIVIPPQVWHTFTALDQGVEALCFFSPRFVKDCPDIVVKRN